MTLKMFIVLLFMIPSVVCAHEEVSLYNLEGKPGAYIDEEMTIYLWSGTPVAYLHNESGKLNIYGFNGKHLGWFVNGVVYDHEGKTIGGVKEAVKVFSFRLEPEPYKSSKKYKPDKYYREQAPFQPTLSMNWTDLSLRVFLLQGLND